MIFNRIEIVCKECGCTLKSGLDMFGNRGQETCFRCWAKGRDSRFACRNCNQFFGSKELTDKFREHDYISKSTDPSIPRCQFCQNRVGEIT